MSLPRKPQRSLRSGKTGRVRPPKAREVKLPALFVKLESTEPWRTLYAQARIRVRKGCYQYLVWRDGKKTCEFYLGKRENHTPRSWIPQLAGAGGRGDVARAAVRGIK